MTFHGGDFPVSTRSFNPQRRRFTLSVYLADGPVMANRLVGWLKWRGFDLDRAVVRTDEERDAVRIVLTLTGTSEEGQALAATIDRYAPVVSVRQFYAAPVTPSYL